MPKSRIGADWGPTGGRLAGKSGDATQFTLGTANSTLTQARAQMTLVDGLDLKNIGGDPHGSGVIRLMTGGTIQAGEAAQDPGGGTLGTGNLPVKPSIDQASATTWLPSKGPPLFSRKSPGTRRPADGRPADFLPV